MFSKFKKALSFYPATDRNNEQPEISRYRRELPPVHYSLKVQSFSSVKEKCEKYISDVFEAQGFKWRLCLYPNGRKDPNSQSKKRENDYISLYLHIVETDGYPSGWQVHVNFKLFVFDKKNDNYLTIQDITEGGVSCFQEKDLELGFAQFISYKDFYNPSNGFLICDSCVFGVELFVLHSVVDQNPSKDAYPIECSNIFTWDVNKFSEREHWLYIESEMFEAGGMPWTFSVYPKGNDGSTYGPKSVSLCLFLHSSHDLPPEKQISVTYKMHILNKDDSSKNLERASPGIYKYRRKQPPVHYSVKIESFSSVKEKFDSDVFEAQDHKWRLCLYPNGRKDNKSGSQKRENDYISLYLTIVETDAYPSGWKVHVDFKLFLFDEKQDNYLTVQDANGMVRCFNEKKTEWGFRRAISKEDFHNPSNGFHINDTCVLGCEVFVIQSSIVENTPKFGYHVDCPYIFTWDVKTFSKRNHWKYIQSEMFPVGKLAWTLTVYPKGPNREGDVALCLYLHYIQDLPSGKAIFVKYKMLILNNDKSSNNLEKASSGSVQFSKGTSRYEENFIALKDLQEPSNGFIINDALTVQAVVFVL